MSISGYKEGSHLFFNRDGKTISYDLKTQAFYSKTKLGKLRPVKSTAAFFRNTTMSEVAAGFEDEAYRKLITHINKTSGRKSSPAEVLKNLEHYMHLETYTLLGIEFSKPSVFYKPVSQFPKEVIEFMKESQIEFNDSDWEYRYGYEPEFFLNLVRHIRSRWYLDLEVYRIFYKLVVGPYWHDFKRLVRQPEQNLEKLISESRGRVTIGDTGFGCEYKSLFDYLVKVYRTEACSTFDSVSLYKDYLNMSRTIERNKYICVQKEINPDLDERTVGYVNYHKVERYPKYLKIRHDIVLRNYKDWQKETDEEEFKANVITGYEFKQGKFQMVAPKTSQDVKNEGTALHHCVASYVDRIMDGTTQIMFLRQDEKESLVTVEIRAGEIIQARGYNNRGVTDTERQWLSKYAKEMNLTYGQNRHNPNMPSPPCRAIVKWDSYNATLIELGEMVKGL